MSKDKIFAISLIVFAIIILIIAFVLAFSGKGKTNNVDIYNNEKPEELYLVTKSSDKYGVSKIDGTVLVRPECDKITRVDNTLYLKIGTESYLYFLDNGKSVSLGGKESNVVFAYSNTGDTLPYFILQYGESEANSIYKIYKEDGTKYIEKDFALLNDVYAYLGAETKFTPKIFPTNLSASYSLISTIQYPTKDNMTQYVVKAANAVNDYKGIIDETGKILVPVEYTDIQNLTVSDEAIKLIKGEKSYIFTKQEKTIEVENGFDIAIYEGCYVQKRGTTVNKIYDLNGNIVIDGIYKYPDDFKFISVKNSDFYVLLTKASNSYELYDFSNQQKNIQNLTNIVTTYFDFYKNQNNYKLTSLLYSKNGAYYILDLKYLKSYKVTTTGATILSPLDYGITYSGSISI